MSEAKDPAIKLFGKTIQLPEIQAAAAAIDSGGTTTPCSDSPVDDGPNEDPTSSPNSTPDESKSSKVGKEQEPEKDPSGGKLIDNQEEDGVQPLISKELTDANVTCATNENMKTPSVDNDTTTMKTSKTEEDQSEANDSQEKTLKKPDKILPCPRCNSMDTKFCYYNNYNVNQPRHFCKNCQRYWTAGGTMRNVPVGAGRRKNKNSASHYHHITVPEALQNSRADLPNGIHHPPLKLNGTVLTFGSDTPLCESMASVLSIAEKTMRNFSTNGFHKPEGLSIPALYVGGDNRDDHSSRSSVTSASSKDDVSKTVLPGQVMQNCHNFPPQVPFFPGAGWPYQWNSAQWSPPQVAQPAFCPAGFPMPFYPAPPYWSCTVPGPWNINLVTPPTTQNHMAATSGPNSPTLGKHSREDNVLKPTNNEEEETQKENNTERCLWIPKTLRIDVPGEAARSSIWTTLGIKNDEADSLRDGRGLFKAFESKDDEKNHISKTSTVLQANPAALSRSLSFHERS